MSECYCPVWPKNHCEGGDILFSVLVASHQWERTGIKTSKHLACTQPILMKNKPVADHESKTTVLAFLCVFNELNPLTVYLNKSPYIKRQATFTKATIPFTCASCGINTFPMEDRKSTIARRTWSGGCSWSRDDCTANTCRRQTPSHRLQVKNVQGSSLNPNTWNLQTWRRYAAPPIKVARIKLQGPF